jgi:hypothetical protein
MLITIIPAEQIINHFNRVRELLERVRDLLQPRGLPSDILADCMSGSLTLWGVFDESKFGSDEEALLGICVTNVREYWRCNALELLVLCGDNMREWLSDLNDITINYAEDCGCSLRELHGRKGWIRELKKFGFIESDLVMLECPIGEEGLIRTNEFNGNAD